MILNCEKNIVHERPKKREKKNAFATKSRLFAVLSIRFGK